jgi:hypothetical protein
MSIATALLTAGAPADSGRSGAPVAEATYRLNKTGLPWVGLNLSA